MSAWLKALPWGHAPLRFLCNASSSANRHQLGLIHTQSHIRKSLNCPKREVEILSIVFSLNPSSLNPHISTCTSWDSSTLQRFNFRIALLTWTIPWRFEVFESKVLLFSSVFVSVQAPSREVFLPDHSARIWSNQACRCEPVYLRRYWPVLYNYTVDQKCFDSGETHTRLHFLRCSVARFGWNEGETFLYFLIVWTVGGNC